MAKSQDISSSLSYSNKHSSLTLGSISAIKCGNIIQFSVVVSFTQNLNNGTTLFILNGFPKKLIAPSLALSVNSASMHKVVGSVLVNILNDNEIKLIAYGLIENGDTYNTISGTIICASE